MGVRRCTWPMRIRMLGTNFVTGIEVLFRAVSNCLLLNHDAAFSLYIGPTGGCPPLPAGCRLWVGPFIGGMAIRGQGRILRGGDA